MIPPPLIKDSTRDERYDYVEAQWACMHHCELCGRCSMLHGREATEVYRDYINGLREYMDITKEERYQR